MPDELAAPLQVKIDLSVPSSSQASTGRRGTASAASSSPGSDAPPGFAPRPAAHGAAAAPAVPPLAAPGPTLAPGQQARGLPLPIALAPGGAVAGGAAAPVALPVPPHAVAGLAVLPPAPCAYCQGPHSMKNCRDFHHMLQSIYQVCLRRPPALRCAVLGAALFRASSSFRHLCRPSALACMCGSHARAHLVLGLSPHLPAGGVPTGSCSGAAGAAGSAHLRSKLASSGAG